MPITRVYDATALDRLGLPVWAAVTPLARDLTVHAGKGTSHQAARLSAVMEAIERTCAERIDPARVRRAAYAEMRGRGAEPVLDPELFDLPFATAYSAAREISWVRGHDLLGGEPVWVARDLVLSPPIEGVCLGVETNGLAAGNVPVEAVLHALLEVIERDAASLAQARRRHGERDEDVRLRLVALADIPAPAAALVDRLAAAGVGLQVEELTQDIAVPVYRALISDRHFPGREGTSTRFEGLGADLDPVHAITRAITEAVQAHTAMLVGARDAFEGTGENPPGRERFLRWLGAPSERAPLPLPAKGVPPTDLGEQLRLVLARVRAAGLRHCVVVELTRAELGVPVVRVLVPGAAAPYGESTRRPALRLLRALL